jgi:hypothetical protein
MSPASIRVTEEPSSAMMQAYSQPIGPAPITARLFGMQLARTKVVESKIPSAAKSNSGGWCGRDPTAIRITSADRKIGDLLRCSTLTVWGSTNEA